MYEIPYWIAGLTVPDIASYLSERGLSCEGPTPRGETMSSWECRASSQSGNVEREISIVGQDPERVRSVTATVYGDGRMPPEEAVADFLGFVAALPYEGAEPAQAKHWVKEHVTSGGKLAIGSANFELYGEEQARVLRIIAVGEPG